MYCNCYIQFKMLYSVQMDFGPYFTTDLKFKLIIFLISRFVVMLISKGFDIHRQVKINDNNERRFGVLMTPFSFHFRYYRLFLLVVMQVVYIYA